MLQTYHEKPFYNKYHYRASVSEYSPDWVRGSVQRHAQEYLVPEINKWVETNLPAENVRFSSKHKNHNLFYFTDQYTYNQFVNKFKVEINEISIPVPDDQYDVKKDKNPLWYGRFPYRIVLKAGYIDKGSDGVYHYNVDEYFLWCRANCQGDFRKSGLSGNISFFFLNPIDAMSFKLMFADVIVSTDLPDEKIARRILQQRVRDAKKDLKIFKQGGVT
jgi:hypothetical protein